VSVRSGELRAAPYPTLLHPLWLAWFLFGVATVTVAVPAPAALDVRAKFEANFHRRCQKYAFVEQYYQSLERPHKRYIVFTFHAPNFNYGGLGDRLGGLVTAFALAHKYNRNLIVRSANGFASYFRPHYRGNERDAEPAYLWNNSDVWSNFLEAVQNPNLTVYNLKDCVNNVETQAAWSDPEEELVSKCAMDQGVPHTVINFRSNRAYLYRWRHEKHHTSYEEMVSKLFVGQDPRTVDLFEAAGCMLRLTMWPTEQLWTDVHGIYREAENPHESSSSSNNNSSSSSQPATTTTDDSSTLLRSEPFTQIGMHFRCGDRESYAGSKLLLRPARVSAGRQWR
jgi:hypothetical protein